MRNLTTELQDTARSSATPIVELLRHAKLVAARLDATEKAVWVDRELNGYDVTADIPDYRDIASELRFRQNGQPWTRIQLPADNQIRQFYARFKCPLPIVKVVECANMQGVPLFMLPEEELSAWSGVFGAAIAHVEIARWVSKTDMSCIIDRVRGLVFDWAVDLEAKRQGTSMPPIGEKARGSAIHVGTVNTLVSGDGALVSSASDSPGATMPFAATINSPHAVTIAGAGDVTQHLRQAIGKVAAAGLDVATQIQGLHDAIDAASGLTAEQRKESAEQLLCLAEAVATPEHRRTPRAVLKAVAANLRSTLSLSADVAQVVAILFPPVMAYLALAT